MQYETKDGQNIYDIVLKTVGRLEDTYALILQNPEISDIGYSFDNKSVTIDFIPPAPTTPPELVPKTNNIPSFYTIIGREGQSLYDICLMSTNDIGNIYKLMQDNNISNLNQANLLGKPFTFEVANIKDITVYNYFTQKSTVINTGEKINTGKSFDKSFDKSYL